MHLRIRSQIIRAWLIAALLLLVVWLAAAAFNFYDQQVKCELKRVQIDAVSVADVPALIPREGMDKPGCPLIVAATAPSPLPAGVAGPYTVTVTALAARLLFTDAGNSLASQSVTFDISNHSQAAHKINVHFLALEEPITQTVLVFSSSLLPLADTVPAPVAIESNLWSLLRDLDQAMLPQGVILLTIVTTVGTWLLDMRKQGQEQQQSEEKQAHDERHERIHELISLVDTDPMAAIIGLYRLQENPERAAWHPDELSDLEQHIRSKNAEEDMRRLLAQVDQGVSSNRGRVYDDLTAIGACLDGDVSKNCKALCLVFAPPARLAAPAPARDGRWTTRLRLSLQSLWTAMRTRPAPADQPTPAAIFPPSAPTFAPEQHDQITNVAFWLWDKFGDTCRELVVVALHWVTEQNPAHPLLLSELNKEGHRPLASDPRLKPIVPAFAPAYYTYPDVWPANPPPPDAQVQAWLKRHGLRCNPFGCGQASQDSLMAAAWAPPSQWPDIETMDNVAIRSRYDQDRTASALRLKHWWWQDGKPQKVFPVYAPLSWLDNDRQEMVDPLPALARAAGGTWLAILPKNPGAFLDMDAAERQDVAELLNWTAGSASSLRLLLSQAGRVGAGADTALYRRLVTAVAKRPGAPIPGPQASWLALRPAGLVQTVLIIDIRISNPGLTCCQRYLQAVLACSDGLGPAGVRRIIFQPDPGAATTQDLLDLPLQWAPDALTSMLGSRVAFSSQSAGSFLSFGSLFSVEPEQPVIDTGLAMAARGSLQEMLHFGRAIIRLHVEHAPDQEALDVEDADQILGDQEAVA